MRYTPIRVMEAINDAFLKIPREEIKALLKRQESLSIKHGMSMYTSQGTPKVIDVQLRPWVVDRTQYRFFRKACRIMRSALRRAMPLYLANPDVREILPLEPHEHEWMLLANADHLQRPQSVMDRLDSTATFARTDWEENFWFLEPNSVGIGGVHYIQGTCLLTNEWVLPTLRKYLPDLRISFPDDVRQILLKRLMRHTKGIGRRLKRVALIEDQTINEGTDEFSTVAKEFRRWGVQAWTADPRDVAVVRGELTAKGKVVDLLYRDTEITEMFEMVGKKTHRLDGMRQAFVRNQVVSSIAGEFDHKSAWELFTNPEFGRYFTLRQKNLFRKHVLWTRLIWERKTTDPQGKKVDLEAYIRRHREGLVLKPNREYGGEGVVFGHQMTQKGWERYLEKTLRHPQSYVVQQSARVRAELFPVASADGRVRLEPYYAVTGFAGSQEGLAILGRASKEAVVNVSRKGGLIAIWRLG